MRRSNPFANSVKACVSLFLARFCQVGGYLTPVRSGIEQDYRHLARRRRGKNDLTFLQWVDRSS